MQSITKNKVFIDFYKKVMNEYYTKSSAIYLKISTGCLKEKKISEGIKYLEKGI